MGAWLTCSEAANHAETDQSLVVLEVTMIDEQQRPEDLPSRAQHRQDDERLRRFHPFC